MTTPRDGCLAAAMLALGSRDPGGEKVIRLARSIQMLAVDPQVGELVALVRDLYAMPENLRVQQRASTLLTKYERTTT